MTLTVVTLNTWSIRGTSVGARSTPVRLAELCRRLVARHPDVVLLQEVWRWSDFAQLRAAAGLPFHARSDRYRSDHALETGLVILSRHPLDRVRLRIYDRDDPRRSTRKGVLLARARLPDGRALTLANTHLCSNDDARLGPERSPLGEPLFLGGVEHDPNEPIRDAQLRQLTGWLARDTDGPVLLGGDLNTGPQYPLWWSFLEELSHAHPDLHRTLSHALHLPDTYCNRFACHGRSEGRLDHLMGFRGARVLDTRVTFRAPFEAPLPPRLLERLQGFFTGHGSGPTHQLDVSDHYGLRATLRLDPA